MRFACSGRTVQQLLRSSAVKIAAIAVVGLVVTGCATSARPEAAKAPSLALDPSIEAQFVASVTGQIEQLCASAKAATIEQVALYGKACNASDAAGCLKAGLIYMCGAGVTKNDAIAMSLFDKSCTLRDEGGCQIGANTRIARTVTVRDVSGGLARLDASCSRGTAGACATLGSALLMTDLPAM